MRPVLDGQCDRHARAVAFAEAKVNVQECGPTMDARSDARANQDDARRDEAAVSRSEARAPAWIDRACIVVPALDAERSIGAVVDALRAALPAQKQAIFVVDDGSTDGTAKVARDRGCEVLSLGKNHGKGAALRAGFRAGLARGYEVALTVDADGQHPADEARRVMFASADADALVLGIRDLVRAGAPKKNRMSNGISNYFLSRFAGRPLADTQCGLRRYPIRRTLALDVAGNGYDFEGEILLRASWANVPIVEERVRVLYPEDRVTHFRVARDPWRILRTVVAATVVERVRGATKGLRDPARNG